MLSPHSPFTNQDYDSVNSRSLRSWGNMMNLKFVALLALVSAGLISAQAAWSDDDDRWHNAQGQWSKDNDYNEDGYRGQPNGIVGQFNRNQGWNREDNDSRNFHPGWVQGNPGWSANGTRGNWLPGQNGLNNFLGNGQGQGNSRYANGNGNGFGFGIGHHHHHHGDHDRDRMNGMNGMNGINSLGGIGGTFGNGSVTGNIMPRGNWVNGNGWNQGNQEQEHWNQEKQWDR